MNIKIYTTNNCPYCHAAKDLFRSKGLAFEEIDVSGDEAFDNLVKETGRRTVPQIFIDGKLIGGFQELVELDRKGEIEY
ncbi:MAG: glutaredoxin 3 [Deltaproteobacteria bacterium]|nr:glutaredoxin 3 [Deltaproteobacteria bacterium]